MAQKTPTAQAARPRRRRRAAQELPLLQGQGRRGGLQERQPAAALHLGEGQDPQPPHHRRVPPPPAAGRGRGEAGPRDGAAALRARARTMEIILLKDVEKLGLRARSSTSTRGYARNFLLPRRLAEVATPGRVAEVQRIEAERARHEARSRPSRPARSPRRSAKTVLRFEVKAGPTGSLFGSVTPTDIADEIWRTRKIRVDRRKIGVDAIKRIGRYTVPVARLRGRHRRGEDARRARGRRAAARGGARGAGGGGAAEAEAAEAAHAEAHPPRPRRRSPRRTTLEPRRSTTTPSEPVAEDDEPAEDADEPTSVASPAEAEAERGARGGRRRPQRRSHESTGRPRPVEDAGISAASGLGVDRGTCAARCGDLSGRVDRTREHVFRSACHRAAVPATLAADRLVLDTPAGRRL